jgi:diphthamide synthase (EF-2-diphthine--ammonia ligase)
MLIEAKENVSADSTTCVLWSGGKDCFGAYLLSQHRSQIHGGKTLFVTFVPACGDFLCHPLRILESHGNYFGVAHEFIVIDKSDWYLSYQKAFLYLKKHYQVSQVITGDVFSSETKLSEYWLMKLLQALEIKLSLPLLEFDWGEDILDFLKANHICAIVTCSQSKYYHKHFLGQPVSLELITHTNLYNQLDFHLCGENGEYHTTVVDYAGHSFFPKVSLGLPHINRENIWVLDWGAEWLLSNKQRIVPAPD